MAGFQVLQQSRYGEFLYILKVMKFIYTEIHDTKKGVRVYLLFFADFFHRFVSETQIDSEATECLQQAIIISDDGYHFIIRFIHFLISHDVTYLLLGFSERICKISVFFWITQ